MVDKPKMKRLTSLPSTKMGYVSDYINEHRLNLSEKSKETMRRKPYSIGNYKKEKKNDI